MANQANFIIQKPTLNFTVQRPTLSFIKPTIINYYGGVWGSITGTLLNQADLQAALNLKANTSSLATVATSGSYLDLINKPTIPSIAGLLVATNNLSDLNNIITAKTNLGLSTVATSGSYTDLSNKPTIPSITNLVPYTGATSNVNLGVYTIIAGNLSGSNSGDVSIGTSNGLSLIGQILSLQNASSIATGALSSADWNTFNSKQNTIVNSDSITQGITNLFLTTAERTKLSNTSNTNTGDETTATIQTKLGTASATTSGYLLNTDWNTFNNKQNALGFTAENIANKSTSTILGSSDTLYPTQNAVKTYADGLVLGALNYRGGYDASTNLYPTTGGTGISGAVKKGNLWVISVAGILGGQAIQVGDSVIANIDTPGQTSSNWNTLNNNITYVPEDQANKSDSYLASSSTTYASTKALVDGLATKQATLIFGTGLTNTAGTISVNNSQSISVLTNLTTLGIVKTTASGILSSSLIANADIANGVIDLTLKVTGILPTANGGTGLSTIGTTGQVLAVNVAGTGLQYISIPSAPVSSVFGRVGVVVAANGDYTTSQVTEGTNFYYTQARFDTAFGAKTTTNLAEGTNLYYTDTRARNAVSVFGTPLTYNSTTGVFGINQANATISGFLSSTDWNTFNGKQAALGYTPENVNNKSTTYTTPDNVKYPTTLATSTNFRWKDSLVLGNNLGDYQVTSSVTASSALQTAVTALAATGSNHGGGGLSFADGLYNLDTQITVPKYAGIKLKGSGYPRLFTQGPGYAGTRLWATSSMVSMFDWRGDADIQAYANLAVDLSLSDMELNGNNNVTGQLIYAKSTDTLNLQNMRLRGAPTSIYCDFATTLTPVPGANKPGGMFWDHVIFSASGQPGIVIKNSTQNFLQRLWGEQDPANLGPSHVDLYSVDKTVFNLSEFNTVATNGSIFRLFDNSTDPLTGLIIANTKFDAGSTSTIIQENRTNASSKGLFLTGAVITGNLGTGIANAHTNIIALSTVYTMAKSILQAGDITAIGPSGTERILNFKTSTNGSPEKLRSQILISSSAESGSNAGSNFVIRTYADDGSTAKNAIIVTRNDGLTQLLGLKITDTTNGFIQLPQLVSAPGSPVSGFYLYADTTSRFSWKGANGFSRTIDATTITANRIWTMQDVNGTLAILSNTLDQFAAPVASVNFNNQKITNLLDPASSQDAATKFYVDSQSQGLDVKGSVRVATTANITLSGTQTVDVVSAIAGDRILVKDQTIGNQNGIYVVASGTWTRSTDADTSAKVTSGMYAYVSEGTANGSKAYILTTPDPIVLNTTTLTFTVFNGIGNTFGTANRAAQFNSSTGNLEASAVTNTELGYLSGVTSAIQTQFSLKASLTGIETLTNKTLDNSNSVTLKSSNFTLQDSTDTTKRLNLILSGIATATTRTLTAPNVSGTIFTDQGGTISGATTFSSSSTFSSDLIRDGVAGAERAYNLTTAGVKRVSVLISSSAESGSNAGSNFVIRTFADDGVTAKNAIVVTRNDGVTQLLGLKLSGSNGFILYPQLAATPGTAPSGYYQYADTTGRLAWIGTNGFTRTFDGTANTANRIYTLPDTSGVLAFLSQTNKLVVSVGKAGSNANFITSSYATEDLAFQAAFDSIASTGGIVRALGANVTYTWANSVKQYNNTILEGEGFGTIIQAANSFIAVTPTGMRPFMLYNNSSTAIGQNPFTYIDYNIGVRDITFDGNPTGQSGRLGAIGFQFVTNVFVLRVKTQNCGATYFGTGTDKETQGIFFRNCKNSYIKDSIDFATDGFTLSYYENALIDNCSGENGTSEFIFLGSGKKGAANNCRALNYAGYGFLVTGNGDIVNKPVSDSGFINCIASGCGNSGALGYYDGFSVTEGYRNFVINCTSYNNQRNGILLSNAYQTRIIGNTIYNNSQQLAGTYSGIVIQGTDGYNIITNNNSYDDQATPTQKFGIYETGTQTSNYIYNNFGTGNITSFISQLSFTALNEAIQLSNPRVSGIILDPNGKNSIGIESTANAVNYVAFKNNAAGNAPQIIARGTDANISLKFITKGTGASVFSPAIEIQDNTTFSQRGQINTSLITAGNLRVFNLPDLSGVIALTSQITGTNSGVNTGDETTATIQTKLGVATTSTSGYLTLTDWNTFNNKQASLGYLPLNPANNLSEVIPATARTNLGLVIGTNIQAYSANTTLLGNIVTGSGSIVLATSPTLITPILGVATATTLNKVTFTTPATGSTLTILDGFTLTVNANATVAGTNTGDQTTITGNAGTATTLQTARAINGVSFNGSADITIADSTKLAKAGDTITGDIANTGTGYFRLPNGTTLQRPGTPTTGMVRFNTDTGRHEFYAASTWLNHARLSGDTFTGAIFATNLSGTNTGDQTITLTGDIAGSGIGSFATTLATVNSNVGSFTYASLTVNAKGLITAASSGITPEVPLTFSTGLTRTINTITVNTSQNIATLSNLVTNGFVKTSGGTGTLSVDTNTYIVTGGNAGSATVLQTARTINGVSFDGSANIIVADSTKLPLSGGTLTGRLIGNASTAAGSTINIPAGIAPTTPVEGDVWNDSTQKAQTTFTDGINQKLVGCVFTQTVNAAAVANTTAQTTVIGSGIGTLTLPANFFVVGKTVRITWYGIVSTTGTPTLLMVGFLGASNIAGTNATTLGTLTFVGIKAELLITCRSVGATGTVRAQTMFMASGNVIGVSGAGNTIIDTTASQTIDLRVQWGTASASNTLTGVNAMVEILN